MNNTSSLFNTTTDTEAFDLLYDGINAPRPTQRILSAQSGFRGTIAGQAGYKIYVVVNAEGVQYVGCTKTSIGDRLRLGHVRRLAGLNGYHGYKWLERPELRLYVFNLAKLLPLATSPELTPKRLAERVEAEVVFAVRTATGHWPHGQNEIHFHNLPDQPELNKLTTDVARQMYQIVEEAGKL